MKNSELIFNKCSKQSKRIYKTKSFFRGNQFIPLRITHSQDEINGFALADIIAEFNALKKHHRKPIKFLIDLGEIIFSDKITYLILDAIIYHIFMHSNFNVAFKGNFNNKSYYNSGVASAAFFRTHDDGLLNKKTFIEAYEKFSFNKEWNYRFFISRERFNTDHEVVSLVQNDSATFLGFKLDSDSVDAISEIISELVSNVKSHNDGDCIVDIDFSKIAQMNNEDVDNLIGCKVAVLNFSENCLGDRIRSKIEEKDFDINDPNYSGIINAYNYHSQYFSDKYTEEDFYNICTFQKHITTRKTTIGNAGTGLTNLIEHLIDKCVDNYSYVLSGNRIMYFLEDSIGVSENGEIGFNKKFTFQNELPHEDVIVPSRLEVPGTLYHLAFVFEERELNNDKYD